MVNISREMQKKKRWLVDRCCWFTLLCTKLRNIGYSSQKLYVCKRRVMSLPGHIHRGGAKATWYRRHHIVITGLTLTNTALTSIDRLKCSKCLPSTRSHHLDLSHWAACYLLPTAPVRLAPYSLFHSSQNTTATEAGDRRWCHRSIRWNYRVWGPSVVKTLRVTWLLHHLLFFCCLTHILSTTHIKRLCHNI